LVGTAAAHAVGFGSVAVVRRSTGFATSVTVHLHGTDYFWWRAVGALVVALAVQVGTNYANDYSDGIRGTDDVRVGPVRLVAGGLASPGSVRRAALASFAVAGVVGLLLARASSWWVVLVGAACLLAGWFYTGGPRPYGYAGFGELFVFVFFGLVATVGTFYVESLRLDLGVVWFAGTAVGLLATALLLANNLRDIATDGVSGKRTLAVRVGRRTGGWCYAAAVGTPFAGVVVWAVLSISGSVAASAPGVAFLPLAALPLAVRPVRLALSEAEGRALLPVLAATGRLQLAFGALLAVALWFWIPFTLPAGLS
jgi:1,4-dihydroxy-2-naphthoate octaprenyltransferase